MLNYLPFFALEKICPEKPFPKNTVPFPWTSFKLVSASFSTNQVLLPNLKTVSDGSCQMNNLNKRKKKQKIKFGIC